MAEHEMMLKSSEIIESTKINILAQDVVKLVYKNQLTALKNTLDRFHIPEYYYSILGDKDEASCMTYADSEWSLFYLERGQKTNLRKTGDISEACGILLRDMSEDDDEHRQMTDYYRHQVDESASIHPTSAEVYKTIEIGLGKIAGVAGL